MHVTSGYNGDGCLVVRRGVGNVTVRTMVSESKRGNGMGDYLTENELSELTGRRQPKRQAVWLARNGWRFAVADHGRPRVTRAYWSKRLGDDMTAVPMRAEPDFAALGDTA